MAIHMCLRCKKEVEDTEENEFDTKSIRNCGLCLDCFDDDFVNNSKIWHSTPTTKGEKDV